MKMVRLHLSQLQDSMKILLTLMCFFGLSGSLTAGTAENANDVESPGGACQITGVTQVCAGQSATWCAPSGMASYLWSTGASTDCIVVSVSGTYTVTVTDANGVQSTCSETFAVRPGPSCSVGGSASICPGDSSLFCGSRDNIAYQWSTGDTACCIWVKTAGTYAVTVTDSFGCTSTCSKTLRVKNRPVCNITGDSQICDGGSTQLCATPGLASYSWGNGQTTACITVNKDDTYQVTVQNAAGCTSSCSFKVTVTPPGSCKITGPGEICNGTTATWCADPGASYEWSTGATTQCISLQKAGTYTVTVTDANGCKQVCSRRLIVRSRPSAAITGNLYPCAGMSTTLCAPASLSSYLWNNGATTQCITVNNGGRYTVTVTNMFGCTNTRSVTVRYTCREGMQDDMVSSDENAIEAKAYPNPFSESTIIEFMNNDQDANVQVELFNTSGERVMSLFDGDAVTGEMYRVQVDGSNLSPGIYFYRIIRGDLVLNRKLVMIR